MLNANNTSNSSKAAVVASSTSYMTMVNVVIYSVICLVGTVGNGLVIYVTGCRMKRTVNSVWFLNLALADFLFTAFLIFLIISASQEYHWQFGSFVCKLNSFVGVVNMFASIFLLMAISLDRCLSIWVVVWAQNKRTVRKAQIISAVIWVAAVLCSTPYASFRNVRTIREKTYCTYVTNTPLWTLAIFRFVMGFFVPFLVICGTYVAISVRARRLQRTRSRKCRRVIFSIVFAFFICWLPFHIVHFIEINYRHKPEVGKIVRIAGPVTIYLAFLNSCLNPILYVFMCDEFQKKLKQSVCFVLESALAEDHLSFMSSRSLSSHLSRISRKSESAASTDGKVKPTSFNFTECKTDVNEEREALSTE